MNPMNAPTPRQRQIQQFVASHCPAGAQLSPLMGDASFRRYIRIHLPDGGSLMLMDAPPEKENVASYLAVARHLHKQGYSAPAIMAQDEAEGLLLLEDLGDDTFTRLLKDAPAREETFYAAAIDMLAQWHGDKKLVDASALPLPLYDTALLMKEAALFADWYLPQIVGVARAAQLAPEYLELWRSLLNGHGLGVSCFVHRDYHADNLMWLVPRQDTARVGLLDFQDAVYGDAAYDLASLLEDARRDIAPALAQAMIERYVQAASIPREEFLRAYALLAAQRNSKIIGIFTRLAARDEKHHYLHYLPRVWRHLEHDVTHPMLLPLKAWLDKHIAAQHRGVIAITHGADTLMLSA
jgi:aminoglycoside/choline kinase family phosphotransferase